MSARTHKAVLCGAIVAASTLPSIATGGDSGTTLTDESGDATVRRTDPGNDGFIDPMSALPDVTSISASGWQADDAAVDPYTGNVVDGDGADLFRMDVVFDGVINPPGTLGLGSTPFDPFIFGLSPVFGFVEVNLDSRDDTGGEIGGGATLRYFANVARFGEVPEGSDSDLAALSGEALDLDFFTEPFYERSGQDYSLNLCGCFFVAIVDTFGDSNGFFDAGDTWIVRGRFWQRAGGYEEASAAFGGSFFGLYDPVVNLRFSHDIATDTTTVTLVEALTMEGAAQLEGEPVQPIDLNVSNHTSVEEAITDIKVGASDPFLSTEARILVEEWQDRPVDDALNPSDWEFNAILGTSYVFAEESLYVWTDAAGDHEFADLNADSFITQADASAFDARLASLDGSPSDADGVADGAFEIINFGENFELIDLNGDGIADSDDRSMIVGDGIPGDCDGDGTVGFSDLVCILGAFGTGPGPADCDGSGDVSFSDLVCALSLFG